jgi:transposase
VTDSRDDRIAELEKLLAQRDAELAQRDLRIEQLVQRMSLLEAHLRRSLRGRFIPSAETLIHDPGQQRLDLPGLSELTPAPPPLADVPDGTPGAGSPPPRRRPGRRRSLAERYPDLEIDLHEVDLEPHEKIDADGTPLVRMGWEDSETIVWGIAAPVIRRTRRYRYGRSDTGDKIAIASVPARITPQGILADETIHSAVVGHVLDALPWHRQEGMSERAGCRISRSVLVNAFTAWCSLMQPLADEIRAYVLAQPVIGADSSYMPHQDGKKPLRCTHTGLWAMTDGIAVAMQWTPDLRHERVAEVLGGYRGTLIRDEWKGWKDLNPLAVDPPDQPPTTVAMGGCHAHGRRRFTDLQGVDARADRILQRYQILYGFERDAVEQSLDGADLVEAREQIRAQRSRPVWERILSDAQAIVAHDAPSTAIYRAANYLVKYRVTLERYLTDGRMPMDNNGTENALRIVALLRKNRLFLGRTVEAGPRLAVALTVLRSCHLVGINPMTYLSLVTPELLKLRDGSIAWKAGMLAHLLPQAVGLQRRERTLGSSSIARVG